MTTPNNKFDPRIKKVIKFSLWVAASHVCIVMLSAVPPIHPIANGPGFFIAFSVLWLTAVLLSCISVAACVMALVLLLKQANTEGHTGSRKFVGLLLLGLLANGLPLILIFGGILSLLTDTVAIHR